MLSSPSPWDYGNLELLNANPRASEPFFVHEHSRCGPFSLWSEFVYTLSISVIQNRNLEGGEEERIGFCSWWGVAEIFFQHLGEFSALIFKKRLILNPEHTSHIYRPRDGFTKMSNPRKPVPYCCRNSHTKKVPFWCFPDFMNIRLIVHWRENIFSPYLVRKNSATLGQGCCRISFMVKSNIWLLIIAI